MQQSPNFWVVYSDNQAPVLAFPFTDKISVCTVMQLEENLTEKTVSEEKLLELDRQIVSNEVFRQMRDETEFDMEEI